MRVAFGLGSNIGDRVAHLRAAVAGLAEGGVGQLRVSSAYETDPVGGPAQPDYLNAVAVGETNLAATELLSLAKSLEHGSYPQGLVLQGLRQAQQLGGRQVRLTHGDGVEVVRLGRAPDRVGLVRARHPQLADTALGKTRDSRPQVGDAVSDVGAQAECDPCLLYTSPSPR